MHDVAYILGIGTGPCCKGGIHASACLFYTFNILTSYTYIYLYGPFPGTLHRSLSPRSHFLPSPSIAMSNTRSQGKRGNLWCVPPTSNSCRGAIFTTLICYPSVKPIVGPGILHTLCQRGAQRNCCHANSSLEALCVEGRIVLSQ